MYNIRKEGIETKDYMMIWVFFFYLNTEQYIDRAGDPRVNMEQYLLSESICHVQYVVQAQIQLCGGFPQLCRSSSGQASTGEIFHQYLKI